MTQWSKLFPQRIFDRGEIYFENQDVFFRFMFLTRIGR